MNARNALLTALVVIAMVGCSPESASPSAADAASAPAPSGYLWQPEGIVIGFNYHLRNDRIYKTKNGEVRRRVVLEYLEGDFPSAIASIEQSVTSAGFKSRPRQEKSSGRTILSFSKAAYGTIRVNVYEHAGETPSNPDAKGMVIFNFPVNTATQSEPTADSISGQ